MTSFMIYVRQQNNVFFNDAFYLPGFAQTEEYQPEKANFLCYD